MPDSMKPNTIHLATEDDKIALQYLGAAVVLQWPKLAENAQKALIQQAISVGGLPLVTTLHEQITTLIRRTHDQKA